MNTKDMEIGDRIFALFKGDPGAGKSIAAGSFPDPYFMMWEPRIAPVVNFWRKRGKEFDYDIFQDFYRTWEKLESLYESCPYSTIVGDSVTSLSSVILRTMLESRASGAKKIVRGGIEAYQIEDYGGEDRGIVQIIDRLIAIGLRHNVNIILTAHVLASESTNLKGVTTQTRRLVTAGNKIAPKIPVPFDEAWHFHVKPDFDPDKGPQYEIITQNVGTDWAKTALPLPMRIDFTEKSLYDEVMKYVKKENTILSAVAL